MGDLPVIKAASEGDVLVDVFLKREADERPSFVVIVTDRQSSKAEVEALVYVSGGPAGAGFSWPE